MTINYCFRTFSIEYVLFKDLIEMLYSTKLYFKNKKDLKCIKSWISKLALISCSMFKCAVQIRGKETLNKIKAYAIINLSGQSKSIY